MAAKNLISNSQHKISRLKWETTFPIEFFHKIWSVIGDCKYNYIAEIKIAKKKYSVALSWDEQILKKARKMLIYANYHNDVMIDAIFFYIKRSAALS